MTGLNHGAGLAIGVLVALLAVPAAAQERLDRGKSGAQLFASDCALGHKSPQGLAKAGGIFGVASFLREHYTASRESAGAIAAYLDAVEKATPPARRAAPKRAAKPPPKSSDTKPSEAKPSEAKPAENKSSGAAEAKPVDAKPVEAKPADVKPADAKAGEAAPAPASKSE
jgi:hypothetical protein